jgi:hypothetical protein
MDSDRIEGCSEVTVHRTVHRPHNKTWLKFCQVSLFFDSLVISTHVAGAAS